ncbi:MAG: DUF4325 domain-containing protein [Cytophagales bacterium]|nr:MAG: DUF4325 domain-containing protein [Cytophagales bacterium]
MKKISVLEIIGKPNAMSRIAGNLVFDALKPIIDSREKVILSFEGLKVCTASFINSSIGKLYGHFGIDLDNYLELTNVNTFWQEHIDEDRFLYTNPEEMKKHLDALEYALTQ